MQFVSWNVRAGEETHGKRRPAAWTFWALVGLLAVLVLTVPGCSGCRKEDDTDSDPDKEKPKPDFEVARLYVQPSDSAISRNAVKPGHYISTTQQMKANNFDFRAVLETASTSSGGQPLPVDDTRFTMAMSRTAILPKGQVKNFETQYFIPRRTDGDKQAVWLQSRLTRGGREVSGAMQPTTRMPDYQYYFLTLASDPDSYGYLKQLDSIEVPKVDFLDDEQVMYYRVVLPKLGRDPPLPSNALAWTMIAYLLWDEVNPTLLDRDQQRALVDWLHWGGQIIVSGPDSLDLLRGSFLGPYLPATAESAVELRKDDFADLNEYWSMDAINPPRRLTLDVLDEKPLVGVRLNVHPEATPIPHTGGLVVERQVGIGRIVVTAFPLSALNVVNWGSFDSFFNTCLLRRPSRVWEVKDATARLFWAGPFRNLEQDASVATSLRYFSRDISELSGDSATGDAATGNAATGDAPERVETHWRRHGYRSWSGSGLGGWNDYSGVASAVRDALKDAAGITIPKSGFVFRVLAIYLIVLVPVNWGVFRMLGRVEWAWVAAPLIAIVGAVAVVRLAQLDIGFARSRTELATLEIHGAYPRAHLTRYSALYTSLSTSYDLEFDETTSLAQPFPAQRGHHASHRRVTFYEQDGKMRLTGFQVDSNSTGMVHSEQMYDLGGSLQLTGNSTRGFQVRNDTELDLHDVGVLRKTSDGLELAWIGDMGARTSHDLKFERSDSPRFAQWDESNVTLSHEGQVERVLARSDADKNQYLTPDEFAVAAPDTQGEFAELDADGDGLLSRPELVEWSRRTRSGEISIGRLIDLASRQLLLLPGDVRLVGWTEQELPGVNYRPRAAQSIVRMLVLAHLRHGPLPAPDRDINCRLSVAEADDGDTEEDDDTKEDDGDKKNSISAEVDSNDDS